MSADHETQIAAGSPRKGNRRLRFGAVLVLVALGAGLGTVFAVVGSGAAKGPKVAAEVPVTPLDVRQGLSNNSPAVVVDPTDPRVVVIANRVDAPSFGCALQVSGDGGETWVSAAPVPQLPDGSDTCYAPEVAFNPAGELEYLFVGLHGRGNEPTGAFLTKSRDRGRTFSVPQQVLGPLNFGVRMAVDTTVAGRGRMHLAWLHATSPPGLGSLAPVPNPILTAYSDDGGATFSDPVQVSDPARARVVAPVLTLGPDRVVHVGYYDLGRDARDYEGLAGPVWEEAWSVVVATSVDGGHSFGLGVVVDDQVAPPDRPMLIFTMAPPALVTHRRDACTAWTDARNGDPDVLLRCSTDRGSTWGAVHRVNDDRMGNGIRQYLPRLSFAPSGRLDVGFLDRRYHPDNAQIDVSYTSSTDLGRSFTPNLRLSRESSSSTVGARYEGPAAEGQVEIGGRLGLLSSRSTALVAWPDSRNSFPGTEQDLYAAKVTPEGAGRAQQARRAGIGLLGALTIALGLVVALRRRRDREVPLSPQDEAVEGRRGSEEPATSRSPRFTRQTVIAVVILAGLVGGATAVAALGRSRPALHGPEVIDITMRDYHFDYRPPAHAGRVVFQVRNAGHKDHRVGIYLLPKDLPPIDVQLRGSDRKSVEKIADPFPRHPGETQRFAVDLVPGQRYALLSFLRAGKNTKTDAELGMNSEFQVT